MPMPRSSAVNDSPKDLRKGGQQDESDAMSAEAVLWLHELPESVRPKKTCARFPRIVNRLASVWGNATACSGYFNELLLDRRGDRQGFPMEIAFELAALKNFFETAVHPSQQTIWDDIIQRGRAK